VMFYDYLTYFANKHYFLQIQKSRSFKIEACGRRAIVLKLKN